MVSINGAFCNCYSILPAWFHSFRLVPFLVIREWDSFWWTYFLYILVYSFILHESSILITKKKVHISHILTQFNIYTLFQEKDIVPLY